MAVKGKSVFGPNKRIVQNKITLRQFDNIYIFFTVTLQYIRLHLKLRCASKPGAHDPSHRLLLNSPWVRKGPPCQSLAVGGGGGGVLQKPGTGR